MTTLLAIYMEKPMKFLIIQLRQIGDVLISTVLCETLKKNFPEAQVDFVVYPFTLSVVEKNPYIDNLIILPNKKNVILGTLSFLKKIRREKYDYCIDVVNTNKSAILSYLSGAKHVIGPFIPRFRRHLHSILVKGDPDFLLLNTACNSVKNRLELLTPIKKDLTYTTKYKIYLDEQEREETREFLIQQGIDFSRPIFFCAPVGKRLMKEEEHSYYIVAVAK